MNNQLNPIVETNDMLLSAIENAMDDAEATQASKTVLADLCIAHVYANRLGRALLLPPVVEANHVEHKPKALPPLKLSDQAAPTKRVGLKLKSPFDYDCPTCGADRQTKCFKYDRKGANAKRLDERHESPHYSHTARQALSKAANATAKAKYDKEHSS